jgi:UDP-N-acetylglucosamine 4-epimerase
MLVAARDAGVSRFVFASSSAVYGDAGFAPIHEDRPCSPTSPYAVGKMACEQYAKVFGETYGFSSVALRYFSVHGPSQPWDGPASGVVPRWIRSLLDEGSVEMYGDGMASRDFCHVDNVVQMNILAATAHLGKGMSTFNCGEQQRTTLRELHAILKMEIANRWPQLSLRDPRMMPARTWDAKHSMASIETAKSVLGYKPSSQVLDGLKKTIEWYLDRESTLAQASGVEFDADVGTGIRNVTME